MKELTTGMRMGRFKEKIAAFQQCVWFVVATMLIAMSIEPVNGFSIGAKIQQSAGCYHNGTIYAERSLIPSVEPCLTCRCQNKSLVCALKVCPEQVNIPPRGCVLIHPKRACCPYLSCKTFRINGAQNEIAARLDQIGYAHYYEHEQNNDHNQLQQRSDDIDLFEDNNVCIEDGSVYGSGSAMVSSNFCSYCYCFAGKRICVNPKCQLPNSSCRPLYAEGSCCPVHYDCSANATSEVTEKNTANSMIQSNSVQNRNYLRKTKLPENKGKCYAKGVSYFDGQKLPTDKQRPCEMCFCIRGNVMCTPKKCAPYIGNCKPLIPEGECCAVGYECRTKANETTRHFRQDTGDEFDLFALLFGDEKPSATTTDVPDVETSSQKTNLETTTNQILKEKGFFDYLREGLTLLDQSEEENETTEEEEVFSSTVSDEKSTTEYSSTNFAEEMERVTMIEHSTEQESIISSTSTLTPMVKNEEISTKSPSTTIQTTTKAPSTTVKTTNSPTTKSSTTEMTKIVETTTDTSTSVSNLDEQTEIIGTEIHINTVPTMQSTNLVTSRSTSTSTMPITTTTTSTTLPPLVPFKPLNYGNSTKGILEVLFNMFDLGKTTKPPQPVVLRHSPPPPMTSDVNINPLIVEPQYNLDYDAPTLPPSLPNLNFISFVPDDAVELRTDDLAKYPSITEQTSIDRYDDVEKIHHSDFDHIGEIPVNGGWGDYYTNYRPLSYEQKPPRTGIDRFSPPMQTEGGFIPREPTRTKPGFIDSLYITTEEPMKVQTAYKEQLLLEQPLHLPNIFDQSIISITTNIPPTTPSVPNITASVEPTIRVETIPIFKGIPATLQQLSIPQNLDPAFVENENRRKSDEMTEHILNEIGVIRVGSVEPVPHHVPNIVQAVTISTSTSTTTQKPTTTEIPSDVKQIISDLGVESREANPIIHTKHDKLNDINNILQLSGCNIYGEMYKIGEHIEELSNHCTQCICSSTGVKCVDTGCDI